mmetsp:Transcript_26083/g.43438  ORF Transcript_26083/g.43438 Transcript_26083/m.43438 type:complete len:124 (-) Transcript_26083:1016-1387(-)
MDCGLQEAYNESRVLKAVHNSTKIICGMIVWEKSGAEKIYFGPLAVLPEKKGQGIGSLLMNEVYKIALSMGIHFIEIAVVNVRSDIIPMYERLGYRLCGEAPFPHPERLNRSVFFYIYQKSLQ